jgi:hypothetical protein
VASHHKGTLHAKAVSGVVGLARVSSGPNLPHQAAAGAAAISPRYEKQRANSGDWSGSEVETGSSDDEFVGFEWKDVKNLSRLNSASSSSAAAAAAAAAASNQMSARFPPTS